MDVKIAPDWKEVLAPEFEKPYFATLTDFVRQEYASRRIYPRGSNIFRAFDNVSVRAAEGRHHRTGPLPRTRQANGLCFSTGRRHPRSRPPLQNIFNGGRPDDTGTPIPASGNLDRWAEQGVLLLNSVLTVREHEAASHAGRGWETFTDAVVRAIAERKEGIVYMLWGQLRTEEGAPSPTRSATSYSRPVHPLHRSRSTAGSSAAATSRGPTTTCARSARNRSSGSPTGTHIRP